MSSLNVAAQEIIRPDKEISIEQPFSPKKDENGSDYISVKNIKNVTPQTAELKQESS